MIAEQRARLPRDGDSKKQTSSAPSSEGSIYATSSLHTLGRGSFTSGGETSGAYFPSSSGHGQDGTNIRDFSHLTYGSESGLPEEAPEEGSKKKKVMFVHKKKTVFL